MKIQRVRSRGWLFTFDDIENTFTNVYVIQGKHHYFICDTYLGPKPMEKIKKHLYKEAKKLPFIVFNSHYHWDHIWGNCAFEDSLIIGQASIVNMIHMYSESELTRFKKYQQGKVTILPPSIVFKYFLAFPDEKITIFKSPGHTFDSASLYDVFDKVLYAGDNIEDPIPYLENTDFEPYLQTIQRYENLDFKVIIPGHMTKPDELPTKKILKSNAKYIKAIYDKDNLSTYQRKKYRDIHRENLISLEKLGYVPFEGESI
ncbi:MAG TPA: MBL fold metallo-hydrolase [Caldisericia bacterium]|jgi:glyoxylase-like metal-dependent hydrolase (beta-lactamase superfamily II)|nr:MBL fold metallo-hydrolase [Caldisericia bacterium]HXK52157.1 MBL fold metallo-hydrolase [Caldisericia bacterium]